MTERQLPAAGRREAPHRAQLVLRELALQHPELATATGGPAGWLLVWDAQIAPQIIRSPARFSLDYLFVDADAVPILVVVTRSTDTRVRREAIGRVLDLAANGAPGWSASQLRTALTATHGNAGRTLAAWRRGTTPDLDDFFARVEDNLHRAGCASSSPPTSFRTSCAEWWASSMSNWTAPGSMRWNFRDPHPPPVSQPWRRGCAVRRSGAPFGRRRTHPTNWSGPPPRKPVQSSAGSRPWPAS
ncbi:MAG: hypothetical protein QM695_12970 [Micropruina sp.]